MKPIWRASSISNSRSARTDHLRTGTPQGPAGRPGSQKSRRRSRPFSPRCAPRGRDGLAYRSGVPALRGRHNAFRGATSKKSPVSMTESHGWNCTPIRAIIPAWQSPLWRFPRSIPQRPTPTRVPPPSCPAITRYHSKCTMRIATWNINSVRRRLPLVLDWLTASKPDVLCLQETKVPDGEFPAVAFRDAGYHVAFRGMKGYNGVATLSRREPESVSHGFCAGPDSEDVRLLETVIDGLPIVNTYVPQGYRIGTDKYVYKLEWFHRVRRYFSQQLDPTMPAIWLGDLNVAPEPIDVYHAEHRVNDPDFHIDARDAYRHAVGWDSSMCFGNSILIGCSTPTGIISGTPSGTIGGGASTIFWRQPRWPPFAAPAMWTWKHAAPPVHPITPWSGLISIITALRAGINPGGMRAGGGWGRHGRRMETANPAAGRGFSALIRTRGITS